MVKQPWDYPWSSIHAHLSGNDPKQIVNPERILEIAGDWKTYLQQAQQSQPEGIRQHERTGRVLCDENFIELAERLLGRELKKKKPGPKS